MNRKDLIAGLPAMLITAGCATARGQVDRAIAPLSSNVSIVITDLDGRTVNYQHNSRVVVPAASLIKLYIMYACYRWSAHWKSFIDLRTRINVGAHPADSEYFADRDGVSVTVKTLLELMITKSDNVAANHIISLLTLRRINAVIDRAGCRNSFLSGYFLPSFTQEKPGAYTTAEDITRLLLDITKRARAGGLEAQPYLQMIDLMLRQEDRRLIPAGIPAAIPVGNKTGEISNVLNDSAIIDPFGRVPVVATMLAYKVNHYDAALSSFNKVGFIIFNKLFETYMEE